MAELGELTRLINKQLEELEQATYCLSDLKNEFRNTVSVIKEECEITEDTKSLVFLEDIMQKICYGDYGYSLADWEDFLCEVLSELPEETSAFLADTSVETDIEGEVHFTGERLG